MEAFIELPFPPSVNTYWRHSQRGTYLSPQGKAFRVNALAAIKSQDIRQFGEARVKVQISLHRGDKRDYDVDNYSKGVLDALTHSGVLADDEQVDELRIVRGEIAKDGACYVTIKEA
jgi:crossover junction endodeoxyribonuclease RusA